LKRRRTKGEKMTDEIAIFGGGLTTIIMMLIGFRGIESLIVPILVLIVICVIHDKKEEELRPYKENVKLLGDSLDARLSEIKEKDAEIMRLKADSCYIENARLKTELKEKDAEWRKKITDKIEKIEKEYQFGTTKGSLTFEGAKIIKELKGLLE
jgi:hypothetical protein